MKALIIYDRTGRIWSIVYGEEAAPQGLLSLFADIPDGAVLEHIDVTDSVNPKPMYRYMSPELVAKGSGGSDHPQTPEADSPGK